MYVYITSASPPHATVSFISVQYEWKYSTSLLKLIKRDTVQPEIFARNLILRFAIENNSQNLNLANNYSLNSLCNNCVILSRDPQLNHVRAYVRCIFAGGGGSSGWD